MSSTKRTWRKWTSEEDELLRQAVASHSSNSPKDRLSWSYIAQSVPDRRDVRCRERWSNILDPNVNRGPYTAAEDALIIQTYNDNGPKWVEIARLLNSRRTGDLVKHHARTLLNSKNTNKRKTPPSIDIRTFFEPTTVSSSGRSAMDVGQAHTQPNGTSQVPAQSSIHSSIRSFLFRAAKRWQGENTTSPKYKSMTNNSDAAVTKSKKSPPGCNPTVFSKKNNQEDDNDDEDLAAVWRKQQLLRRRGEWKPSGGWKAPRWAVPLQSAPPAGTPATLPVAVAGRTRTAATAADATTTAMVATSKGNLDDIQPGSRVNSKSKQGAATSHILADLIANHMPAIDERQPVSQKKGTDKDVDDDQPSAALTNVNDAGTAQGGTRPTAAGTDQPFQSKQEPTEAASARLFRTQPSYLSEATGTDCVNILSGAFINPMADTLAGQGQALPTLTPGSVTRSFQYSQDNSTTARKESHQVRKSMEKNSVWKTMGSWMDRMSTRHTISFSEDEDTDGDNCDNVVIPASTGAATKLSSNSVLMHKGTETQPQRDGQKLGDVDKIKPPNSPTTKSKHVSLNSVRYPTYVTPTDDLLISAHAAMCALLPEGDCEDLDVLRTAVSYYEYWRPKTGETRVILLAESHAFTDKDRVLDGPGLDPRFLAGSYDGPRDFVSLVYCLAYGEEQALADIPTAATTTTSAADNNNNETKKKVSAGSGTTQFWSLLAACSRGTAEPAAIPKNDICKSKFAFAADVLKGGGLSVEQRLAAKLEILQDLQKRGIWLIDASLFGWYITQPQKYCRSKITNEVHRLAKERPPKFLKAPAFVLAWEMYTKHVIRQVAQEGSLQLLVPIGMEVEASLTRARIEDAVHVVDAKGVVPTTVSEAFPAPNAWIPGGYGPFFTKLAIIVGEAAPPLSNKADLEGIESLKLSADANLCFSVRNPQDSNEVREKIVVDSSVLHNVAIGQKSSKQHRDETPSHFGMKWDGASTRSTLRVLGASSLLVNDTAGNDEDKSKRQKPKSHMTAELEQALAQVRAMTADDNNALVPMLALDCNGLEPFAFHPLGGEGEFTAVGKATNTHYAAVDLSDGDWSDYDLSTGSVSVTNFESEFQ